MGQCTKCGAKFVILPEGPDVIALCKYCTIDNLNIENRNLREEIDCLSELADTIDAALGITPDNKSGVAVRLNHQICGLIAAISAKKRHERKQ